ncbi:MAG: hypothetical protein R3C49_26675 [Planctomycetaceae bacterium]
MLNLSSSTAAALCRIASVRNPATAQSMFRVIVLLSVFAAEIHVCFQPQTSGESSQLRAQSCELASRCLPEKSQDTAAAPDRGSVLHFGAMQPTVGSLQMHFTAAAAAVARATSLAEFAHRAMLDSLRI